MIKEKPHAALNHSAIDEESEDEDEDEDEEPQLRTNNSFSKRDSSSLQNEKTPKESSSLTGLMQTGIKLKLGTLKTVLKKKASSDVLMPHQENNQEEGILGDNT